MNKIKAFLQSTPYKKFRKNMFGVAFLMFIVLMIFVSVFAYVLAPDKTKNANWGDLSIKSKQPGFEVLMLNLPIENASKFRFSEYFFGQKDRFYKYPIQNYHIENDKIIYIPYNDDLDR